MREYPKIIDLNRTAKRKISFITVHFSDEINHNLLRSSCVHDANNELIIVDNRGNCFFDNLSKALNYGVRQAHYELMVLIHEDTFLLDGWQQHFEKSLDILELKDPDWYVLGSIGYDSDHQLHGNCSYPYQYLNDLEPYSFREIDMLDEHILIFKKSSWIDLDEAVPSIHFIGRYIVWAAKAVKRKAYLIDAPTIHKYADQNGKLINSPHDSEKIAHRETLAFKAEYDLCKEYLFDKQRRLSGESETKDAHFLDINIIEMPIILLAHNTDDTRTLSAFVKDTVALTEINYTDFGNHGDFLMVINKAIIRKYRCIEWQRKLIVSELQMTVSKLTQDLMAGQRWGWALLENFYLLPELLAAFPLAKFIYLHNRNDANSSNIWMGTSLDNEIGRITLPLAYDYTNQPRNALLSNTSKIRIRQIKLHQKELIQDFIDNYAVSCFEFDQDEIWQSSPKTKYRLLQFLKLSISDSDGY
jgi:hypothetical protein